MKTFKLSQNSRARAVLRRSQRQDNVSTPSFKTVSLVVEDQSDYHARVAKLENLQMDLLEKQLYSRIAPLDICQGQFEVLAGYEEVLAGIAAEHGFKVVAA